MPPHEHPRDAFYIVFFVCWAYFLPYSSTADASSRTSPGAFYIVFFVCRAYFPQYFLTADASSRIPPKRIPHCIFRMLSILSPRLFNSRCLLTNISRRRQSAAATSQEPAPSSHRITKSYQMAIRNLSGFAFWGWLATSGSLSRVATGRRPSCWRVRRTGCADALWALEALRGTLELFDGAPEGAPVLPAAQSQIEEL